MATPAPLPADGPGLRNFFAAVIDAFEQALREAAPGGHCRFADGSEVPRDLVAHVRTQRERLLNKPDSAALPEIRAILTALQAGPRPRTTSPTEPSYALWRLLFQS